MSSQTSVSGVSAPVEETAARAVARNTGEFLHDLVTLAELQIRLLFIDGQEGAAKFVWPVVTIAVGLIVACAALPVGLIAFALMLTEMARFTPAQAAGISAAAGLALGAVVAGIGYLALRSPKSAPFERSSREWRQNMRWIKDALQKSVREPSRNLSGHPARQSREWVHHANN